VQFRNRLIAELDSERDDVICERLKFILQVIHLHRVHQIDISYHVYCIHPYVSFTSPTILLFSIVYNLYFGLFLKLITTSKNISGIHFCANKLQTLLLFYAYCFCVSLSMNPSYSSSVQ